MSKLLLEEINLDCCYGLKRFSICGLPNLKRVQIHSKNEIERVDMEAPNLCYLLINNSKGKAAPFMNLISCRKLKTFCYFGFPLKSFNDFLSNFPIIENLFLSLTPHYDNLKLTVRSLRRLQIQSNRDLEKLVIHTSNFLLFEYYGISSRLNPFQTDHASQLKACMKSDSKKLVDTLWFQKFRQFLDKYNGFKILKLFITAKFKDIEELKVLHSPPYELEHVELGPANIVKLPVLVAVVDAVLWCCRPRSLTLRFDDQFIFLNSQIKVFKYTYEKLLQQEDQGHINIRIVLCYSSEPKQHFSDLNSMLKLLNRGNEIDTITFIKEEVVQEAGYMDQ